MPASAEAQAALVKRFIEAWESWNPDAYLDCCSDDFVQVTMPYSLQVPARNKTEVSHVLPQLMNVVKDYKLEVGDINYDVAKSKAAFYSTATGTTQWGPWKMEYATYLTFNEGADKIVHLEEMLDSNEFKEFAPKFIQHMKENGA